MNIDPDLNDVLRNAMGTETLLAHDLMPDGLPSSSKDPRSSRGTWQSTKPRISVIRRSFPYPTTLAFDIFACPAISCECERAFSRANKLITPERNSLGDSLIEALECLRAWWNNGLIKRSLD